MNPTTERSTRGGTTHGLWSHCTAYRVEEPTQDRRRRARCLPASDVESRNRIVQENLRLVMQVARRYVNRGLTLDDLVAEGNLGLIRAAEQYDSSYGTKFSTYAMFYIRDAIQSALANTATTIRLPMNVSRLLERWHRTERKLWHVHGHQPTFAEVATAMGLDEASQRVIDKARRVTCMQEQQAAPLVRDWLEWRAADGGARPEESLADEEEQRSVSRRLERLEAKERAVIVLRYGLEGEPPLSLQQIRDRLGITRAAVEKLVSDAIRKLRRTG
jgi:RNA polymerase primary sigma factor